MKNIKKEEDVDEEEREREQNTFHTISNGDGKIRSYSL